MVNPGKAPRWSPEEEALLREKYPDLPISEIARLIPAHTPHSIEAKASRMKLHKSQAYYRQLALTMKEFNFGHCFVCHGRVDLGRQDDLCLEKVTEADFVITMQGGGRRSAFFRVEEKCFTLEEALADSVLGPFARKWVERVHRIAAATKNLTLGGPP